MLRPILAILLAVHGIGHILFLLPLLGLTDATGWGQSTRSWLFTSEAVARVLGSALWIVAIAGFCAAAYGLWSQQAWWRGAAVAAAAASAVGLVLFWVNPGSSSAVMALVFNGLVVAALVLFHFPTIEAVGA